MSSIKLKRQSVRVRDRALRPGSAGAGVTVAGGGTATYLKNEDGVLIKLIATDVGLKFTLSGAGVHVALQK